MPWMIEQQKMVEEYERLLAPRLKLGEKHSRIEFGPLRIERMNIELKTRLKRLLSLLKADSIPQPPL
jgi:hypothetical protein